MKPLAALLALACIATAADEVEKTRAAVEARLEKGDTTAAAALLGTAVARAQRKGDLQLEEALARIARETLRDLKADGEPDVAARYRDACHALMKALDPKRGGAFLSAHLLAYEVIFQSVRAGDDVHLADAAAVVKRYAKSRDAGACALAMAELADGLVAVRGRDSETGVAHLHKAWDAFRQAGWNELAIYPAVELVLSEEGPRGAVPLMSTLKEIQDGKDVFAAQTLTRLLATRSRDDALKDALTRELQDLVAAGVVGGAGGAGGAGGSGGSALSPAGEAWPRFPASRPFVSVTRTASGFDVRHGFAPDFQATVPFRPGVKHQAANGVTLSFCGHGVALAMIDLTGRNGQPGEGWAPSPFELFHPLAPGETWAVTKKGVVTVK